MAGCCVVTSMSEFLTGMVVFFLIALGLGGLIFFSARSLGQRDFHISRRAFAYSLLIPVALGVIFLGFFAFYEYHETPAFCGELCHSMGPKYEGYEHPQNNSMMIVHKEEGVSCTGCHVGPGWSGQVEALLAVPNEFISEAFNTYDIDDLGGIMHEESCWKCHDGSHAIQPGNVTTVLGDQVNPHVGDPNCFTCHPAHSAGFGVSLSTCELCHGHAVADWNTSMEKHGTRTGGDCLDCHDRKHPEDAMVPWSKVESILSMEFCGDCHPDRYDEWVNSSTEESQELYGDCVDCHTEHLSSHAFHTEAPPYDQCGNCHPSFADRGDIHDRTGVTYAGVEDVGNDLCEACHIEQVERLDLNKQHRGLECVYCHDDHLVAYDVTFSECTVCHDDRIPEDHEGITTSCTSGACHGYGWFH